LASSFVSPTPVDFTRTSPKQLTRKQMIVAVTKGSKDTAMMGFNTVLNRKEIASVVDFVRQEFMINKKVNTKYHTVANGWENHEQYASAFPFALHELPLDTPWDKLTPQQR